MNEYLSKYFIEKILDAHLEDSRGAEHYAYDVVKCELMSAPGADVVEVKHGRWIQELADCVSGLFSCSVCNYKIQDNRIYGWETEPSANYCPNCGAKMR